MAGRTPPRYVPTLTEVVKAPSAPVPAPAPVRAASPAPVALASPVPPAVPTFSEEEWVHRIMQRVDITLDRRLREAVAAVVVDQVRNLIPLVREQVEEVVREAVAQAIEDELEATRTPPRPLT